MSKLKVAVVAGEVQQPRFLRMFESLSDTFEVTVFAIDKGELLLTHHASLRLKVYESSTDIPGYMRGLEDDLARFDVIIGIENSRISSFQAIRAARKYGRPCGIIVNEFLPFFYESYQNIRAIQFDICQKADRFWPTSVLAANNLNLEGVSEKSIKLLRPTIDLNHFKKDQKARQQFRNYVGIAPDERVILFRGDLTNASRASDVMNAVAWVMKRHPQGGPPLRVIFAGQGETTMDLKYQAFDLKLGRNAMFLHQSVEPFLVDLLNAADVVMVPRPLPTLTHELLPLDVLEAMACGVVPIVDAGSIAAELASSAAVVATATKEALAAAILQLLGPSDVLLRASDLSRATAESLYSLGALRRTFCEELRMLIDSYQQSYVTSNQRFIQTKVAIEADLAQGHKHEALVKIEEMLLICPPGSEEAGEMYCLKGEALLAIGELEQAMAAFSECLKFNTTCLRALRGLGYVSWKGHSNEEALIFFKKALAQKNDDEATILGIGLVYRRLGLLEEAMFWLERCLTRENASRTAIVAFAQVCGQCSHPKTGIRAIERVMELIGEQHTLLVVLGQLYLNDGKPELGHAILQRALGSEGGKLVG